MEDNEEMRTLADDITFALESTTGDYIGSDDVQVVRFGFGDSWSITLPNGHKYDLILSRES